MQIVNHRIDGAPYRGAASIGRQIVPTLLVVHDTAGSLTKGNVVSYFAGKDCKVSAHIVVERDGSFTQMVPFDRAAAHAGVSSWNGRSGCNAFAIGIEIVNPGMMMRRGDEAQLIYPKNKVISRYKISECSEVNTPEHGHGWCLPYTPEQVETVKQLARAICSEYGISDIVGHYHISPRRKVDVTPLFPLHEVRDFARTPPVEDTPSVRPDADVDDMPEAAPSAVTLQDDPQPEPAIVRAGLMSSLDSADRSFAWVNRLADQGSRAAQGLRAFKQWVWKLISAPLIALGAAFGIVDTSNGNGAVVASNPALVWFVLGVVAGASAAGLAAYLYVKFRVEPGFVSAARDGRYRPRGA